ncbi:recombinase [Polaribacter vadi]|uniref:Recombinase n=1 Tax=Polaribacter vadi TaxID=1774273 RepID=A0A1B8TT96_9FLAO|nr:site-specific integrase [Polaribacter vadi]AOW18160.1 recombinase [Polaribacter vadi]OBY62891.1 recombinase [Polaribacter vadi]
MQNTFSILFYPKKNHTNKDGKTPIYMRITVNGRRSELSIQRKIDISSWNLKAGKVRGTTPEVRSLNRLMDVLKNKIYTIHQELIEKNIPITSKALKNSYLGIGEKEKMLIEIFTTHNNQMEKLVGKEYALNTLKRYKTTLKHIQYFLTNNLKINEIAIKRINHQFLTDFEFYLKSEKNCNHNSTMRYLKSLKKIIGIALANNWIDKDPFINYKTQSKETEREYLSKEELQTMINKELKIVRLAQVRDIFIFCCYTGLAYSDVQKLTDNNLVRGIDGEMWVKFNRTKTDTRSNIPLLPIPLQILEKYKEAHTLQENNKLLPVLSNQKMNAYIKEIADVCGIQKNLTFHLARHTFATTVTLSNGVPIESVSKMLGHKSLKTTQHYAKILDRKVSDDMFLLKEKLKKENKDTVIKVKAN